MLFLTTAAGPLACTDTQPDAEAPTAGADTAMAEPMAPADQAMNAATVEVRQQEPYGEFLVDGTGMSLYLFLADTQGESSSCYDACAEAWPTLLTENDPQAGDPSADASMLATIERNDGSRHVTYNGWPHYAEDQQPGDGRT